MPALIQTTKMGQIFVLDRRTGKPVTKVEERPVDTNGAEGEKLSPTQPFSVGMPQIGNATLTEQDMWGISTFDQLACRIDFKDSVYNGLYTAPGENHISNGLACLVASTGVGSRLMSPLA